MTSLNPLLAALWHNAWTIIPLTLAAAALCRWVLRRPATRHAVWCSVLLWCIVPAVLPLSQVLAGVRGLHRPVMSWLATQSTVIETAASPTAPAPAEADIAAADAPAPLPATLERLAIFSQLPAVLDEPIYSLAPPQPVAHAQADRDGRLAPPHDPDGQLVPYIAAPRLTARASSRVETGSAALPLPSAASTDPVDAPAPSPVQTEMPASPSSPAAAPPAPPAWQIALAAWYDAAQAVWQTLVNVPTLPAPVWLSGIALLAALYVLQSLRFRWTLRGAHPAPPAVVRQVQRVARRLGLRAAPETLLVERRISPLIWCGRKTRLVLPADLWRRLDPAARNAVLCHELAHLRRGDHWVRRLELVVAALLWWNPLVWWVRHRLNEEAELSCDAWVTWLLPNRRRAYAEALLSTRAYLATAGAAPAGALGITTRTAKRLARRLTMVMTETNRPRISLAGLACAGLLAAAGWVTSPAWSCPPEDAADAHAAHVQVIVGGKDDRAAERALRAQALIADDGDGNGASFRTYVRRSDEAPARDEVRVEARRDDVTTRDRYERRLAELAEQLAQLRAELRRSRGNDAAPQSAPPARLRDRERVRRFFPQPPTPPAPPSPRGLFWNQEDEGGLVWRSYQLPEDKLARFVDLMSRQDVPVLVRPAGDHIEIQATARNHRVIAAFINAIRPKLADRDYTLEGDKGEAFAELLALDTVPVYVSGRDDGFNVRGPDDKLDAIGAFLALIDPNPQREKDLQRFFERQQPFSTGPRAAVRFQRGGMQDAQQQLRGLLDSARARQRVEREAARTRERQARDMERRAKDLARQAEELERKAEQIRQQREELRQQQGQDENEEHERRGAALELKLEGLESQLRNLDAISTALEQQAEQLDAVAERNLEPLEEEIESLQEALEELSNAAAHHATTAYARALTRGFAEFDVDADADLGAMIDRAIEEATQGAAVEPAAPVPPAAPARATPPTPATPSTPATLPTPAAPPAPAAATVPSALADL